MKTLLKGNQELWALTNKCVTDNLETQEAIIKYVDYLHSRIRDYDIMINNFSHGIESRVQSPMEQERINQIL